MASIPKSPAYGIISAEETQAPATRQALYGRLEEQLGMPVLSYFTSFRFPVMMDDSDVQLIEQALQASDFSRGCALLINSPGGDGLAAENIINLCRTYSGTGSYIALVPRRAKSAATMVCFGASKIRMGPSAELGPIDPQLFIDGTPFSVCNLVESYQDLFKRAVANKTGRIEPFLQQLAHYDEREIKEYENAISLSTEIAIKALKSGMMKEKSTKAIEKAIQIFVEPKHTKSHGRPIYAPEAIACGLKIEPITKDSPEWPDLYELNMRLDNLVSSKASKCIETKEHSFIAQTPQQH